MIVGNVIVGAIASIFFVAAVCVVLAIIDAIIEWGDRGSTLGLSVSTVVVVLGCVGSLVLVLWIFNDIGKAILGG